jgi:DNA-binding response OmpR family regulator
MNVRTLVLLTTAAAGVGAVLPALDLLRLDVRVYPPEATALLDMPACDALLIDGRHNLSSVRSLCRIIQHTSIRVPVLVVVTEGGLAAVSADWGVDDVVLSSAGPAEVEARLRLAQGRLAMADATNAEVVVGGGGLTIDESSYSARINDRDLDLTFKEFELMKFLAQHPGRVFTRQQLVDEVWGMDYFGGTRTVDVHVRRLRAKLGPEHEQLIGTVRNVGYRFVLPAQRAVRAPEPGTDPRPDADVTDADVTDADVTDHLPGGVSKPAESTDAPAHRRRGGGPQETVSSRPGSGGR